LSSDCWQAFRTRSNKELEISASHTYEQAGQYRVVVKVIDILGNNTTSDPSRRRGQAH